MYYILFYGSVKVNLWVSKPKNDYLMAYHTSKHNKKVDRVGYF